MKAYLGIAAAVLLLGGCEQLRTAQGGLSVYQTVSNPAVPLQDKACTVLDWGVPVAMQRATTLTIRQQQYADTAARAAAAYCRGKDLTWQARAVAAAEELSLVLWDVLK